MGESRYEPLSQAEDVLPVNGTSYPLSHYQSPAAVYEERPASSSSSDDEDGEDEKNYPGISVDDEELDDRTIHREKDPVGGQFDVPCHEYSADPTPET